MWLSGKSIRLDHGGSRAQIPSGNRYFFSDCSFHLISCSKFLRVTFHRYLLLGRVTQSFVITYLFTCYIVLGVFILRH